MKDRPPLYPVGKGQAVWKNEIGHKNFAIARVATCVGSMMKQAGCKIRKILDFRWSRIRFRNRRKIQVNRVGHADGRRLARLPAGRRRTKSATEERARQENVNGAGGQHTRLPQHKTNA